MENEKSRKLNAPVSIAQHVMAALLAFFLMVIFAGQTVVLTGPKGNVSYDIFESDRSRRYEDTVLFNNILGNNISVIARLVAIRSQLETDGVYDREKPVDVTAYVNRGTTLPGYYITAQYTVENLLKWSQNGFDYETRTMTGNDMMRFLAPKTTYTRILNNSVSGGMNSYLNSRIEGNTETIVAYPYEVESGETGLETVGDEGYVFFNDPDYYNDSGENDHSILINRYKTTDGKNIEELVSDWSDYLTLCSNVTEVATDLNRNYDEYNRLMQYYTPENSRLRYYIVRTVGGKREIYTNVSELINTIGNTEVSEYFNGLKRSISYCPYELSYQTNTLIREDTFRSIFKQYSYAYPDQIRVYIGVDMSAAGQKDDFSMGRELSAKYLPSIPLMQLLAVICAVLYVFLGVVRIMNTRGEHRLIDRLPTEILLILWFAVLFVLIYLFYAFVYENSQVISQRSRLLYPACSGVCAFVLNLVFMTGLLAAIRKGRDHNLWTDSILRRICLGVKRMALFAVKHTNIAVSTVLPCIILAAVNIAAYPLFDLTGIAAAVIIDLAAIAMLYTHRIKHREIADGLERINNGETGYKLDTAHMYGENKRLAQAVNSISVGIEDAVRTSMKDERLKTDLITNVSHDIKTPLTSIINYVDLLKREDIGNERAEAYIRILDEKSQRLKQLTEDLVEVSRISSGNIEMSPVSLNLVEFMHQTLGEFSEKFEDNGLIPVFETKAEAVYISADPHYLWRVAENLLSNAAKYAMTGTRLYIDLMIGSADENRPAMASLSFKNVSKEQLHIDPEELTERFIRGDASRTTEGSGLGLSIAQSLTKALGGEMVIDIDGDLFKVTLLFPVI